MSTCHASALPDPRRTLPRLSFLRRSKVEDYDLHNPGNPPICVDGDGIGQFVSTPAQVGAEVQRCSRAVEFGYKAVTKLAFDLVGGDDR